MKENQPGANLLENKSILSEDEVKFLAGIRGGKRIYRKSKNSHTAPFSQIGSISRKMSRYEGLEHTLRSVSRLPFTAEDMLSEREAEISMLLLAGYSLDELSKISGLGKQTIRTFGRRVKAKRVQKRDKNVPEIHIEGDNENTIGLIKAMHSVIVSENKNVEHVVERRSNLSINESTTLLWICTGRSDKEIGAEMKTSPETVRVYMKRAAIKLGVKGGRYPLIDRTLSEIIKDEQKAKAA